MEKDEKLLNDFEDKYLKTKKINRCLLIVIIILILIIIITIVYFLLIKKNQGQEKENLESSNKCPVIKEVIGGHKGNGYIYRLWDCCKPGCSWTRNAGAGNEARQCDANMNILTDKNAESICGGGPSTTCLSQIPFTIDGCDNMGFAFAKIPGGKTMCGKCFLLEFTGKGKDVDRQHYKLLIPRKLIIMANNFSGDEMGDTNIMFSILIPGESTAPGNGCSTILGDNLGNKYGGLSGKCAEEIGFYHDDNIIYTKRKECLINKCNNVFANITQAREGCLFFANFLEVAGDAVHNFTEIECPQVLKDKY